jgi:tetratricopeptide (TPR) repeat protein
LLVLVLVAYSNSFSGGLEGDSGPLVTQDPRVQHATRANLALVFTQHYWYPTADSAVYRPLVTLSWMFNYVLLGNGERASGYHAVNLALHMANVMLAWLLALEIWKKPLPAFFTAAIFALHPVNTEAVANVAGRADLMAALGVLAALVVHARMTDAGGWRKASGVGGISAAALFGMFSKENAVVLPVAMLLYDLVLRRERPLDWRRRLPGYAAASAAVMILLVVRHAIFSRLPSADPPFVDNPLVGADFWTARLTALDVIWRYVGLLLWPRWLSWDHSYNQIPMATPAMGLASLAGISLALVALAWLFRRHPAPCFFGAFFFVALAPVSNLLLLIGTIMAERFLYLPSLGFAGCVVAAAGLHGSGRRSAPVRLAIVGVLVVVVVALGGRTWQRNFDWTDGERLWASAAEACPNSFKTQLAVIYGLSRRGLSLGNIDTAIDKARQAVEIVDPLPPPDKPTAALTTLGTLYKMKGDLLVYQDPAAVDGWYRRAVETLSQAVPNDRAYTQERRRRELARGWPSERIPVNGYGPLYDNLSDAYRALGRLPEAADALRYRVRLTPLVGELHARIAALESAMGQPVDAIVSLWVADTLKPTSDVERLLASAYQELDPRGCAVANQSPASPNRDCPLVRTHMCSAHVRLVAVLTNSGRPDDAERYRRQAVRDYGCQVR